MRQYAPPKSDATMPSSGAGPGGIAIPSPRAGAIGQLRSLIDTRQASAAAGPFEDAANGDVVQRVENHQYLSNVLFTSDAAEASGRDLSDESSLDMATHAMTNAAGLAFVINSIVSYQELGNLPAVVAAMTESLAEEDLSRVALIIGVNATRSQEAAMRSAVDEARDMINGYPFAIALVPMTFEGAFPYGTMRNQVLHSHETRAMTEYFVHLGLHPYVSIQDFDTGSRRVGNNETGQHVFHALDALLADTEDDDDDDGAVVGMPGVQSTASSSGVHEDGAVVGMPGVQPTASSSGAHETDDDDDAVVGMSGVQSTADGGDVYEEDDDQPYLGMLPLMIAGGYRAVHGPGLKERTRSRLEKGGTRLDDEALEKHLSEFVPSIAEDMSHRERYARLHPLLPYAPEPNLFLDATAVMRGSPRGTRLLFGPGAAEFVEMGKSINRFAADELEAYFGHAYRTGGLSQEEARNQMAVHAGNLRHPVRGASFVADYAGLNVETDLSRIAASAHTNARAAQSHAGLTTLVDRFYNSKPDKSGAEASVAREKFTKLIGARRDISSLDLEGHRPGSFKIGKTMSEALSVPFGKEGPFKGLHHGVPTSLKKPFLYQVAIESERVAYMDRQIQHRALIDNFRTNAFALHGRPGVQLAVSQWTVADGDCGIYALGLLKGEASATRAGLVAHLRGLRTEAATAAANDISGDNETQWLSHDDLTNIGHILGLADIAIVTFNLELNQWAVVRGDPSSSAHIVGGVPASVGGPINHWVVLRRR